MSEVTFILDNLSTILSYYIPGAIALSAFLFLSSLTMSIGAQTIYAVILSFCVKSFVDAIDPILGVQGFSHQWSYVVYIIVALVGSIIACFIFQSKLFKHILNQSFHKFPHDDIWNNILSYNDGAVLTFYFDYEGKNKIIGQLWTHEENGADQRFALVNYSVIVDDEIIYSSRSSGYNPYIVVRPSEAVYVEVINTTPEALNSTSNDE